MSTFTPRQHELLGNVRAYCRRTGHAWSTVLARMVGEAGGLAAFRGQWQLTTDEFDQVMDTLRYDPESARGELVAVVDEAIRADHLTEVERMQRIREAHHTYQQALAAPAVAS